MSRMCRVRDSHIQILTCQSFEFKSASRHGAENTGCFQLTLPSQFSPFPTNTVEDSRLATLQFLKWFITKIENTLHAIWIASRKPSDNTRYFQLILHRNFLFFQQDVIRLLKVGNNTWPIYESREWDVVVYIRIKLNWFVDPLYQRCKSQIGW